MLYLVLAALVVLIGVAPLLAMRRLRGAFALGALGFLLFGWVFYGGSVSLVWPCFGVPGFCVALLWLGAAILAGFGRAPYARLIWLLPACYAAWLALTAVAASHFVRAKEYAALLGPLPERRWTQDVQPKDPHHLRLVSSSTALYLAKKAVANAGAIGSQFVLSSDGLTLQKRGDRLIYAIPFDFAGFSQWQSSGGAPGYIIVDAEIPDRAPQLVTLLPDHRLRYTPEAYFGSNLERHLRENGYLWAGLETPRFEIDDAGNPQWVVPIFRPTLGWAGERIVGAALVDPATGLVTGYSLSEIPAWVDRIFSGDLIADYVDERGEYADGWWNHFWGQRGLTTSERPILVYGSDHRLQWVTGVTSTNTRDDSLIGLIYTDSHSGRSVFYRTNGGATDTAILQAVDSNQQVKFRHLHATTPQIYNLAGAMTSVVPLVNDSDAFQAVALVSVANPQDVAVGGTTAEALRSYAAVAFRHEHGLGIGTAHALVRLQGVVDRIRQDVTPSGSLYLFHLRGTPRIFTASAGDYVKIALTQPGDTVTLAYLPSSTDTAAVQEFDNTSLPLAH